MRARSDDARGRGAARPSIMGGLMIAACLALMSGCDGRGADTPEPPHQSRVPDNNVLGDQVKALDRAEAVENILLQGAERRQRAIDQQTQ